MPGETFISRLELIGHLDDDDRHALRAIRGELRDVGRGAQLISVGDRPSHVVGIVTGLLHRFTVTDDGERQIHAFYLPTDVPSAETLHMPVMDTAISATVPSRILLVEHAEILAVLDRRPNVRDLLWRETLVQASMFRTWLMRNSQMVAEVRMAHLFCELFWRARAAGAASNGSLSFPVSHADLSAALGMTTVQANRTLKLLEDTGAVKLRHGMLSLNDPEQLKNFAQFDPSYLHLRPR
ncbi:Crp/Fnr family transcriptional regulator [Rhizorhabdus argentea]|uniref:Crp/Fnr family transcriptional regulator n=1 Tax=Rhizorhabdus argentea TaxID=1387174 RepID=UPI0030EC5065